MPKIPHITKLLSLPLAALFLCASIAGCSAPPASSDSTDAIAAGLPPTTAEKTAPSTLPTAATAPTLPTIPYITPTAPDTESWTADAQGNYAAYGTLIHDVTIDDSTTPTDPTLPKAPAGETRLGYYEAKYAATPPVIDGDGSDACWSTAAWAPIDQLWLYSMPPDFSGRYKILWNGYKLYYLVEITDDLIMAPFPDPLDNYYNNDCVELFIDEDESGGDHTYNYNAFAYHCSIFDTVADLGEDQQVHLFTDNVQYSIGRDGGKYLWEFAVTIYGDDYVYGQGNSPVQLYAGKDMGFAVAYCDSGLSLTREGFIGSVPIMGDDKNVAYQDASVFAHLKLVN